ncbi:MAG: NAD-dependent epimerase/dehydratase family protein [Myxococcota bacterium]
MKILIAGCGDVGSALATRLLADRHEVFGLRRRVDALPPGLGRVAADLARPETLGSLPRDLDVVVYAAGPGSADEAAYRAAYVEGQRHLARALAEQGGPPGRWIFTSSTAVYGQSQGEWVDEDSPTAPVRFSGKVLLEAEALADASAAEAGVLRLGGIYGPGRTRLVDSVREGRARLRPGPPHYTNRIHRDDAAAALQCLVEARSLPARVLGVDGSPADENEVLCFLAALLGRPEPPQAGDDEPGPARRAGSKRCRNARLVSLGFRAKYPSYREGYAALIRAEAERKVS